MSVSGVRLKRLQLEQHVSLAKYEFLSFLISVSQKTRNFDASTGNGFIISNKNF